MAEVNLRFVGPWRMYLGVERFTLRAGTVEDAIEQVEENIGTIARSGTRAYLENLKSKQVQDNPELIGQFGVGFYSSFMVADKVVIETRTAGDKGSACRWESTGDGSYTIEDCVKESRGAEITLHLKDAPLMEAVMEFRQQSHALLRDSSPDVLTFGYEPDEETPLWCTAQARPS